MYAALMTGLTDEGTYDPQRQKSLTEYVLKQGLAGLYVGGSSGEQGLLDTSELLEQQRDVATLASGSSAHLIAHVGMPNLRDSLKLATQAKELGYHGLSALPPHSYPFSDEEIFQYYEELAAATDLPLLVYEVPIRTGRPIGLDTLVRILALPNVAGIKFTSNDLFKFSMLKRRCPDSAFFFGFDEIYLSAAALGADGGIGTTYNILGKLYVALHKAVSDRDLATAQELQNTSQIFVEALLETGVLPGMKAAFRAIGIDCGPTRAPMQMRVNNGDDIMAKVMQNPEIKKWVA